jgi:hypothetical protein
MDAPSDAVAVDTARTTTPLLAEHDLGCFDENSHLIARRQGQVLHRLAGDRGRDRLPVTERDLDRGHHVAFVDVLDRGPELTASAELHEGISIGVSGRSRA